MGALIDSKTWLVPNCVISPRNLSHQGVHSRRSVSMLSLSSSASTAFVTRRRSGGCVSRSPRFAPLPVLSSPRTRRTHPAFSRARPSCVAIRYGILEEDKQRLDYVLALSLENFMERRLQTLVFKRGLAKSIHHARVLIRQRHIRVGRQI